MDIYARANTKALADLQAMFAKHILKLETLAKGEIDKRVYELSPVIEDGFEFKIEPSSSIASVLVTRMRVTLNSDRKKRITVEADAHKDAEAVYTLLNQLICRPIL